MKAEYDEIVKNEVQRAISADEEAIGRLCANYIDNIRAYLMKQKVKNKYTGKDEEPDERLMRSIEEKIDITDARKDDFRREIMNFIGHLALEGKKFTYETNDRLRRALEMKLFEDQKDSIKLSSFVSNVIDKETQDKIDIIKNRLIKYYGYNEASATDVLGVRGKHLREGRRKGVTACRSASTRITPGSVASLGAGFGRICASTSPRASCSAVRARTSSRFPSHRSTFRS